MAQLIVCPLCQKKNFDVLFKRDKRQIVQCLNDGLVLVNPQPSLKEIASLYGPKYFKNFDPYLKNREAHLGYFRKKLKQIDKRVKSKGKLLDVGCAVGFFLQEAEKDGWSALGIDVSDFALNHCRQQGLKVRKGTIESVKLPARSFDVITSLQTIEHETNPLNHLKEISRLLKPGGWVVLTTPDHNSWTRRLMGSHWFGYRHQEHLYFLTRETLRKMLKKSGFRKVEMKRDDPRIFTLGYYLTRLADFYPNRVVKMFTGMIKRIIGNFPAPALTDPWGDIIVFAKK
ncbi:MAG TPA: class I SAM-dependent methyltransferase [Patescibacteria group bacterium]|nr:class I SAM-dependent methyltransferase [Patescibacteria group bacterium]